MFQSAVKTKGKLNELYTKFDKQPPKVEILIRTKLNL